VIVAEGLTVRSRVLRDHGVLLLRATGPLRAGNRHILWIAVRKAISECPDAVIVDLSSVRLIDTEAIAVFAGLRRNATASGPGVALMWCGASGTLADRLRRIDQHRPQYEDVDEAISALASGPPGERWLFRRLEPVAASVHTAGVIIVDACASWGAVEVIHSSRRAAHDLVRTVRWCRPRELHLTAYHRDTDLLLCVRSVLDGPHADWCAPRPPLLPVGHHHKRTEIGHIAWTWLPLAVRQRDGAAAATDAGDQRP
jgi:ABC-type transporter Mla MlaB component